MVDAPWVARLPAVAASSKFEGSEIRAESGVKADSQRELRQALTVFLRRKLSVQQSTSLL